MKKITCILTTVLLSVILFSSCSSSNEKTIKIGGVISLTGDNAFLGSQGLNGIQLAVDMTNEKGGINGKQIELITEDSQTSSKGTISAFKKLSSSNKATAYISTGDVELQALNSISNTTENVILATTCTGMISGNRSPYLFRYFFNEAVQWNSKSTPHI